MIATSERVLPTTWALTAGDVAKLCGQPLDEPPHTVLIDDVEGLCRGAMADAQRRRVLSLDMQPGDWMEVLGFLLGEVVKRGQRFDPSRRGIEFRPWLYDELRAFAVVDAQRWLYGRNGRHRLVGSPDLADEDDAHIIDPVDPVDDSRQARLEQALSGGSVDGPEHRLDDLFGVHSGDHRDLLRAVPGLGGEEALEPARGDSGAGRVGDHDFREVAA